MLNVLQARLQQYVKQDVQAVFRKGRRKKRKEKAEESETKLPVFTES